jgi:hypothetical protein
MFVSEFIEWASPSKLVGIFMHLFPTSRDHFMWKNGAGKYDDWIVFESYKAYINEVVSDYNLRRVICNQFGENGEVEEFLQQIDESFADDIKAKYEELESEGFVCEGTEPLPKLLVEENDLRTQLSK